MTWFLDKIIPALAAAILISPISALITFYLVRNRLERKLDQEKKLWELETTFNFSQTKAFHAACLKLLRGFDDYLRPYIPFGPEELYAEPSEFVSEEEIDELHRQWPKIISETVSVVNSLKELNDLGVEEKYLNVVYQFRRFLEELSNRTMLRATSSIDRAYILQQINFALYGFSVFMNQINDHITLEQYLDSQHKLIDETLKRRYLN